MTVIQGTPLFIFVYPKTPDILEGISVVAAVEPAFVEISAQAVFLDAQVFERVELDTTLSVYLTAQAPAVDLTVPRRIDIERRMHRSAWQARLGSRLDPIKRKLLDNNLLLSAHPTDMLRVRSNRDTRTQDVLSRTVVSAEILPIMLPVLTDVPMRRLEKAETGELIVTFAMLEDQKPFEAYCPLSGQLQRDDLLFRILKDPYADLPYVMALQVKDELATFSYSSILYTKYLLTFYDEALPSSIVTEIVKASAKREALKW